jgi:hypothetical protein
MLALFSLAQLLFVEPFQGQSGDIHSWPISSWFSLISLFVFVFLSKWGDEAEAGKHLCILRAVWNICCLILVALPHACIHFLLLVCLLASISTILEVSLSYLSGFFTVALDFCSFLV